MKQWQRYAAEFLGTGTLVFVGTSAVAGLFVNGNGGAAILVAPFAFGIGLLAAVITASPALIPVSALTMVLRDNVALSTASGGKAVTTRPTPMPALSIA